jgi:hypothetical protein
MTPTNHLALKIQILSRAGSNDGSSVNTLLTYRNLDSGFGGSKDYPSNVLDTGFALQGLAAAHSTDTTTVTGTVNYLLAAKNTDGGWGFVKGVASHVYYTAIVMQALETQVQTTTIANALSRATAYLLSQQLPDGSWGNVPDTALALMVIAKTTGDTTVRVAALNWLLGQQLADGSWNDDPYSTALALQALAVGAPLETPPATQVDSVTLSDGSQITTTFGPQQRVTIDVGLNGPPAPLEMVVLDPNGQVDFKETGPGPFSFDTLTLSPGTYTVIVSVLDPATGLPVSQSQTTFTIQGGVGVSGGILAVFPSFTHVGATETVTLASSFTNGSNVSVGLTIQYDVKTPSGTVVTSGSTAVTVTPQTPALSLTLGTFNYTFPERGDYPVQAQIYNGSSLLTTLTGSISAAPLVRIDPSITLTPSTVLPDGDKRIHIDIHLEGLEQQP